MNTTRRATSNASDSVANAFDLYVVPQRHSAYGRSSHTVWREVLERNAVLLEEHGDWVHPEYIEGLRALALPERIPRVEELNERLAPTGWRTVCVDGYIPTVAYVGMISESIFPISRVIRRPEHIDYAPAPDMVHDILGHLPMLFSEKHREFVRRLAGVMACARSNSLDAEFYEANRQMSELKSHPGSALTEIAAAEMRALEVHRALRDNASAMTHLSRMYLWSVEFGLVGDIDQFLVHGAALLSAPTEFRALCERRTRPLSYSLDVIHRDISFSDLQAEYFVARDFAHLTEVLEEYESHMPGDSSETRRSEVRQIARPSQERRHA
jgi:phenylalanine-4-hydroxylase